MDRQRFDRIEELFHAAAQLVGDERDSFVAARCGQDLELRREVLALLNQQTAGLKQLESLLEKRVRGEIHSVQQATAQIPIQTIIVPGSSVGPYEIEGPIGRGGMGEVYRARDTRLGRQVAVKVLSGITSANPAFVERFQREAQAISALNHPNVCTVYDIGNHSGSPYLIMELLEGQTLKERMAGQRISREGILAVMLPILDALEAAHSAGIVHRDIKPANIFITRRGVVKILDFGLAKSTGSETNRPTAALETLTAPGTTVGTISYMSPEQARGKPVDARTDIFACGVVLYQMATGVLPFAGDGWVSSLEALLNATPRAPRELNGDLSPEIELVIARALEKDVEARYQNAAAMRHDLVRALQIPGPPNAPSVVAAQPPRNWKVPAAAIAAALLAAVLVAWYFDFRKHPVTSPSEFVQLTDFSDSASAPALSGDGRMLTFLRGGNPFLTTGAVYVKFLPNGESTRITDDPREKYNPVFTPDGSRVAYTVHNRDENTWDTWTVPVTGGSPSRLMRNAAGMAWIGKGQILFS